MSARSCTSAVAAVAVVALLAGCGDDDDGRHVEVRMLVTADAPAYGAAPWPTDAWRDADGTLASIDGLEAIAPTNTDALRTHLAALDGFGVRPLVELFVDGPLDPASVPAATDSPDAPLALVDVDPSSPAHGNAAPMEWRYDPTRNVIAGSPVPGVVLRDGTRYAVTMTAAVRADDGTPVAQSDALAGLLSGPLDGVPERWRSTADAARERRSTTSSELVGVGAFTTQHATRTLALARGALESLPEPELSFSDPELVFDDAADLARLLGTAERDEDGAEHWGWSNPTGIAHDHVGVIATGTMTTARFTRDVTGAEDPDDETFSTKEPAGAPEVVDPAHAIGVTFVLPAAAPPPAGWPVVLFGHGLGASRHAILTFAEPLTAAGFAVVAIDMADHGARWKDTDNVNNLDPILPEFSGEPEMRDGFADGTGLVSTFAFLRGLVNMSAVRDSVRQSVLDLGQLARLVRRADLDLSALAGPYGGATPRFDATKLAYLGESYGAHVGTVFAAVEPHVELFVLDVPGGGLLDLEIASSPVIGNMLIPLARSVYGIEGGFDRFHPTVALAQSIFDAADPLTYAPRVLREPLEVAGAAVPARHVVAIEAVHDELIPNAATHALARAMGLPLLAPHFGMAEGTLVGPEWSEAFGEISSPASGNLDGRTAALVEYSPATHGANWTSDTGTFQYLPGAPHAGDDAFPTLAKPITVSNPLYETLDQVVELLVTHRTDPAPVLRSTMAPTADFDGDGTTDADEVAAGRDPYDPDR